MIAKMYFILLPLIHVSSETRTDVRPMGTYKRCVHDRYGPYDAFIPKDLQDMEPISLDEDTVTAMCDTYRALGTSLWGGFRTSQRSR